MPPTTNPTQPPQNPPPIGVGIFLNPGEQVICVIYRHFIGLLIIYLEALAGVAALFALIYVTLPSVIDDISGDAYRLVLSGIILALAVLVFVLFVATYVYRQSRLLLTNQGVLQVVQKGLFIRKVSRLSMADVEDVSAEQRGILATILGYGTLSIETAGEKDNFTFSYCPTPDTYANRIAEAREAYIGDSND